MPDGCATIVARDDPHLHATALFAPEPGRSRLMVLYAFDVELSRAAVASVEPMIARMRLQWWRDVVEGARAGADPAHEVAGPFVRLMGEARPPADLVEALIAAREAELEGPFDEVRFGQWADDRFGSLTALAAHLLTGGDVASVTLARRAGPVLGAAFALRHAAAALAANRLLLPGLTMEDRAGLAAGAPTVHAGEVAARLATDGRARLKALRHERAGIDRRAVPALLPLRRAGRVLARASAPGAGIREIDDRGRMFDGLRLAWAAAAGRW